MKREELEAEYNERYVWELMESEVKLKGHDLSSLPFLWLVGHATMSACFTLNNPFYQDLEMFLLCQASQ